MSINFNSNYTGSIFDQARRDLKKIENVGVSKAETLEDLRDTKGKSFKTADLENLMKKYDPASYEEYSKFAYTSEGAHSQSGLSYLSHWIDGVKTNLAKEDKVTNTNDISARNEEKLSKKAQDFLNNLRAKNKDFDFFVGNSTDDLQALSKSGCKEFTVIFSNAELERMANDEKYANEKLDGVEGSIKMAYRIAEEYGLPSGTDADGIGDSTINKIGVIVDDKGTIKLFAELEKNSAQQKERIARSKEKAAEDKKNTERTGKRNPYETDKEPSVKRTTVEAATVEELLEQIRNVDWNTVSDVHSGDRINYEV